MVRPLYSRLFVILTAATALLDQLSKIFILQRQPNLDLTFLKIHLVTNSGAGFGILQNQALLLGFISLLVAIIVVFNYRHIPKEKRSQICFSLFLGGVLGNMIDRFSRGHVIDFLDPPFWPAFNIADAAISVGVIGLIWIASNKHPTRKERIDQNQ